LPCPSLCRAALPVGARAGSSRAASQLRPHPALFRRGAAGPGGPAGALTVYDADVSVDPAGVAIVPGERRFRAELSGLLRRRYGI